VNVDEVVFIIVAVHERVKYTRRAAQHEIMDSGICENTFSFSAAVRRPIDYKEFHREEQIHFDRSIRILHHAKISSRQMKRSD
jgi:hypothetical protein